MLGVDIDIRAHNRAAIEAHPMASRIAMIQGSAVAPDVVQQVRDFAEGYQRVLVCLDSMHTHDHVLGELDAYAPLVTPGSYCVVFDTFVEDMPPKFFADRPWDVGNNPKTAVHQWLAGHDEFESRRRDGAAPTGDGGAAWVLAAQGVIRSLWNEILVETGTIAEWQSVDSYSIGSDLSRLPAYVEAEPIPIACVACCR